MKCMAQTAYGLAVLAAMTVLCDARVADAATLVYEENFNSYTDGEQPSSIYELHDRQLDSGEAIGGHYAVNNGNRHMLITPTVADFDLTFTVEPHSRALRSPQMTIEFRTDPQGQRGYRLAHWMGTYNRLDLTYWDQTTSPPINQKLASPQVPSPCPARRWRRPSAPYPSPISWPKAPFPMSGRAPRTRPSPSSNTPR